MTPITLRGLRKSFGPVDAVAGIDLDIPAGELFFLLGPSGCGKTTLLRMIAGFTDPTAGSIHFGDRAVTHLPPDKRHTGMVFQGYALWPHMTVAQNVAFGLDVRQVARAEKKRRVEAALASVQLTAQAGRKINQLSGGQQQRVALARALVIEPTVLLLDEPLSNLDAKLRTEMRTSIREVCKEAGITAVYVTHDQKEALSMADRIAVLRWGQVVQVGPPRELYARPYTRFVADFLGQTNFIAAEVKGTRGDRVLLDSPAGPLVCEVYPDDLPPTGNVTCSIRPEAIRLTAPQAIPPDASADGQSNHFPVRLTHTIYLGEVAQHDLTTTGEGEGGGGDPAFALTAFELNPRLHPDSEQPLHAHIAPQDVVILRD